MLAAIMFTDMVGYTALMQQDEALARKKRERHREVFNHLHQEFHGQIIQYFGDGTLSIFPSVVEAIQCAVDMQLRLKEPIEVPLRIGIHLGDVVIENDQLIGDAVNVASRVESFAATGSILVSGEIVEQVKNQQQFSFRSMGAFQFKNVQKAKELFAVQHEGIIVPAPDELSGKGRRKENTFKLPRSLTSFVGREREQEEIALLVRNNPLLTLTGPGGSGKTRLSLKVAESIQFDFREGVRWISLAAITDPDMLAFAITESLGLKPGIRDATDHLMQYLAGKQMLLILDNFEQIVSASQWLAELLINCPEIKIIVTSRIILNIAGEVEFPVEPLPLPKPSQINDLDVLRANPAIDLFCQRAKQARRSFELSSKNSSYIAEICTRLDGLPLALELAAARTKIFSPETLLERLGQSLDVLKTRDVQMPERHQTLRQTINWSYKLLDKEEQELLNRLSVFVGGSDFEAIHAVCIQNGLADWDFEEGIEDLLDKSLIKIEERASRFYMLETIREFASDQLKLAVKDEIYKLAHIDYYLQLAENASKKLSSGHEEAQKWTSILDLELTNLKAAIEYAIELGEMKKAYRLGQAMRPFWSNQGSVKEGIQILSKILAIPVSEEIKKDQIEAKLSFGVMCFYLADMKGLEDIFKDCLDFFTKEGNDKKSLEALNHLFFVQVNSGNLTQAEKSFERLKAPLKTMGTHPFSIGVHNNLGFLHFLKGELDQAVTTFEKIVPMAKELGNERWMGYNYSNMSLPLIYKAEYQKAIDLLKFSLKRHREARELTVLQHAINQSCQAYFELGEYEKCQELVDEAHEWNQLSPSEVTLIILSDIRARLALSKNLPDEAEAIIEEYLPVFSKKDLPLMWQINTYRTKCHISFALGKYEELKFYTLRLLKLDKSQSSYLTACLALEFTARLAEVRKDFSLAATLFHIAQAFRRSIHMPVPNSEKEIGAKLQSNLSEMLGSEAFQLAKNESLNLSLQQAIKLCKDYLES
ncbi:MAG: adenylate/guanylate cyclase domain-containing protein [Bacteroidia bacterium]|nr:adenylate/guanylate cyclase domain-containing protein [Bacteroidia bacterium]